MIDWPINDLEIEDAYPAAPHRLASLRREPPKLTEKQQRLLALVRRLGPMTPTEVTAARQDAQHAYAYQELNALERRGLVEKVDVRLFRVTDAGREAAA